MDKNGGIMKEGVRTRIRWFFGAATHNTVRHLNYHRLEWAVGIGLTSFFIGLFLGNEGFKRFSELTLFPAVEAIINRRLD